MCVCVCVLQMTGYAKFKHNDSLAEAPIAVNIKVQDQNDNAPVLPQLPTVSIYEDSPEGVSPLHPQLQTHVYAKTLYECM